ncbi:MAG: four-carbon acid sugar kinase family protein [Ilumatobacteraceae bacterium]
MNRRAYVLADDRTGAAETAGAFAAALGSKVAVTTPAMWTAEGSRSLDEIDLIVVDLGTRHLAPAEATRRCRELIESIGDRALLGQKMDSTLRGNWAAEAVAIRTALGRPVVVVAAFPAAGRVCVDGVVSEHGVPVHLGPAGRDPRMPVRSSRPADLVRAAAPECLVAEAPDLAAAAAALDAGSVDFVVLDASDDRQLVAAAGFVRDRGAVLCGTAAALGALANPSARRAPGVDVVIDGSVVVASASRHPAALAQCEALRDAGANDWVPGELRRTDGTGGVVLVTPWRVPTGTVDPGIRWAESIGDEARGATVALGASTLVLVGGDTAAAALGDEPFIVDGLLAPGVATGFVPALGDVRVVTKPGGFGEPSLLAALLADPLAATATPGDPPADPSAADPPDLPSDRSRAVGPISGRMKR